MTLAEIKSRVMFQTNNDDEDVGDYLPHLVDYINDGYDRVMKVWSKSHVPNDYMNLPAYSDLTFPVSKGQGCIHSDTRYSANQDIQTTETWTAAHWDEITQYDLLELDSDTPDLPVWIHKYLADWATWLIYRNGNPQKQQRGMAFRNSFEEMLATISGEGGVNGLNPDGTQKQYKFFINIPR